MFNSGQLDGAFMEPEGQWELYPRRRSLPLRVLALAMYVYTVAIGVGLIVAPDVLCGSVVVATTVLVVWAVVLTVLVLGQARGAKADEERRQELGL